MYKAIILSKIFDYCKKSGHPIRKSGNVVMLECPFCHGNESANVIPNTSIINCLKCSKRFTLIDLVKEVSGKNFNDEEEALDYVKNLLNLDVQTKKEEEQIESILDKYDALGFCLVPCAKKDKPPIQKGWTEKENRNKAEWAGWIANGLNVGVRTGEVSSITVIDVDILSKQEKVDLVKEETSKERRSEILARKVIPAEIKTIMGDTLIQETLGGFHLFYKYTNLPKTRIQRDGYAIDLENDGGLVIVPPAPAVAVYEEFKEEEKVKKRVIGYAPRKFINDSAIITIPQALEELLLENTSAKSDGKEQGQSNDPGIEAGKVPLLDDGDGRNVIFTKYGGYLLNRFSADQVEYALYGLNKLICKDELPPQEVRNIIKSLERYDDRFSDKLSNDILDYLTLIEMASKAEIEIAVLGKRPSGEAKKKFDEVLTNLTKKEKIVPKGRQYKILPKIRWSGNITQVGVPLDFKCPYFHDYVYLNWGDMVLIGAQTKIGKTTIAMNFIKRLVEQGIKPYYIYSESGGRWAETAMHLGLKDDDFLVPETVTEHIDEITFEKHSINIWDWIDPQDFAKTNMYFSQILKKVERSNSFLIGFVQLKDDKDASWFAQNMIRQRPALAAKYLYDKEQDGSNTQFILTEVRAPRAKGKQFNIPCVYDFATKEIKRVDEIGGK